MGPDRTDQARSLQQLLAESAPEVAYDVERGLARHRQLVLANAPLPEWAAELPRPQRVARRWGRSAWWLVGTLAVLTWLGLRALPTTRESLSTAAVHERQPAALSTGPAPAPRHETTDTPRAVTARRHESFVPTPAVVSTNALGEEAATAEPALPALAAAAPVLEAGSDAESPPPSLPAALSVSPRRRALREALPQPASDRAPHADALDAPGSSAPGMRGGKRAKARAPRDAEEMRQLAEAERLLAIDALAALKLVRAGQQAFQGGYFEQERRYVEVMALFTLARRDEAHTRAAVFLNDYPDGPYRQKVELARLRYPAR